MVTRFFLDYTITKII